MDHWSVQPREILPFAGAAFIGLAAVLLPGPDTDWTLFAISCAATAAITLAGFAAAHRRRGRALILLLPLSYFGVVAILRHSGTTGGSGFVPLIMLPIVWLALFGNRRQLLIGLAAMTIALLVPFLTYGEPRYTAGSRSSRSSSACGRRATCSPVSSGMPPGRRSWPPTRAASSPSSTAARS
jgi:hypothetical protein